MSSPARAARSASRDVRVPQQARSRRTRERLLEAAVACFEQHGYDETTTALIADRAGVAVGTLYGYFRDKREVLLEVLDRFTGEVVDVVLERLDPDAWEGGDPREHARELIDTLFKMQTLRPGMQRVLWERYFKDPDFHAPIENVRERLCGAVEAFCRAIEPAELRPALDIPGAALAVVNAVQWNGLHAYMHGTPEEIDRAAANTAHLVTCFLFHEDHAAHAACPPDELLPA